MITKELFESIQQKHGAYASWAVWREAGAAPKSNTGDMSIFDTAQNPRLLETLNPTIIMAGLNFSDRAAGTAPFSNFHDARATAQDFKIRYAFTGTQFYGAYMTDIIKNYHQKNSAAVMAFLRNNPQIEIQHINNLEQELRDIGSVNPLLIAFGNAAYQLLHKHFAAAYNIKKIKHYSYRIAKEKYRAEVLQALA